MGDPVQRPRPGLTTARKRRGLTQEQAAELVGCSPTTWGRWERGTQEITPNTRETLDEHQYAADCAEQAVHGFGPNYARATQLNTVHMATTYLGLGELDHALTKAKSAVSMANTLTSQRSIQRIKAFDRELAPHIGELRVRQWREYLRSELRVAA